MIHGQHTFRTFHPSEFLCHEPDRSASEYGNGIPFFDACIFYTPIRRWQNIRHEEECFVGKFA